MTNRKRTLGTEIKARRAELGLSQARLAERIGCTQAHISLLEKGSYLPSLTDAKKLAAALGIDIALFLEVA